MIDWWLATAGGFALGICAIPQAFKAWKSKSANDISWMFLLLWAFGDLCLLAFGIRTYLPLAIVLNNVLNALCIIVIAWFK